MFFKRISAPVSLAVFVFVLISHTTWAQTDRAAIEGTVTDASGGAVSGAKIDITAVATGLTDEKMTNQYGQVSFSRNCDWHVQSRRRTQRFRYQRGRCGGRSRG